MRNCREPGAEHVTTIGSETQACTRQGFTTLICTPDLNPIIDHQAAAELITKRARSANLARVLPVAALTKQLQGQELAEMAALKDAGCVAVSNATHSINDDRTLLNALSYAASIDLPIIVDLAQVDPYPGCVDESIYSAQTGLMASPKEWELISLSRYLYLVNKSGIQAHFSNLSCAESLQLIEQAKAKQRTH